MLSQLETFSEFRSFSYFATKAKTRDLLDNKMSCLIAKACVIKGISGWNIHPVTPNWHSGRDFSHPITGSYANHVRPHTHNEFASNYDPKIVLPKSLIFSPKSKGSKFFLYVQHNFKKAKESVFIKSEHAVIGAIFLVSEIVTFCRHFHVQRNNSG